MAPRIRVFENGKPDAMIECVFWRSGHKRYLCLIKNPSNNRAAELLPNGGQGVRGKGAAIKMVFREDVKSLKNLRTGKIVGPGGDIEDLFVPWEANVYRVQ